MITEAIRRGLLSFSLLLAGVFHEPRLPRRTAPRLSERLRPLLLPRIAFRFMQKNIAPAKKNVKKYHKSRIIATSSQFGNFGQSMQSFQTFGGSSSFATLWNPMAAKKST